MGIVWESHQQIVSFRSRTSISPSLSRLHDCISFSMQLHFFKDICYSLIRTTWPCKSHYKCSISHPQNIHIRISPRSNERYWYNFNVLLTADHSDNVSIQSIVHGTQTSNSNRKISSRNFKKIYSWKNVPSYYKHE